MDKTKPKQWFNIRPMGRWVMEGWDWNSLESCKITCPHKDIDPNWVSLEYYKYWRDDMCLSPFGHIWGDGMCVFCGLQKKDCRETMGEVEGWKYHG